MNDRVMLSFDPRSVDYLCAILAQRPYAEVAALLADVNRQLLEMRAAGTQSAAGASPSSGANGAAPVADTPPLPVLN